MQRIMIVDDHEIVRIGLRTLIGRRDDFSVVAEAGSAEEAIRISKKMHPDIVLMDIRLPGRNGIYATKAILNENSDTKVIILTSYASDEIVFEALRAGASGFLLKQIDADEILKALDMVSQGDSMLDPAISNLIMNRLRETSKRQIAQAFDTVSHQELKILNLISRGKTNKEIAKEVHLSEKTVRNYVSSLLNKLNLHTRAEAAAYAVKNSIDTMIIEDDFTFNN